MKYLKSAVTGETLYWHDVHKLLTKASPDVLASLGIEAAYHLPQKPGDKVLLENGIDLRIDLDGKRIADVNGLALIECGDGKLVIYSNLPTHAYALDGQIAKWLLEGAK